MTARQQRAALVVLLVAGVAVATALALSAFRQNMLFFFGPSEVIAGEAPVDYPFRLGGLVADGSVEHAAEELRVRFAVTDGVERIPVYYEGILPDLFREGQGVVVRGLLDASGVFKAEEVLARHDENYMPPEVAAELERVRTKQEAP